MEKWLIILGVTGLFFFLMRRDGMGCCGGGHSREDPSEHTKEKSKENSQQ